MARTKSEVARTKMLDATRELVFRAGVAGLTIDEVARQSGVAKTTIYRHFASKNELLVAALDGTMAVPPTPDTGSLRDDLVEFIGSILPIFANAQVRALFLEIFAATARDSELGKVHQSMMAGRMTPLMTIFERGKARGEVSPDLDFDSAFDFIEGPLIVRSLFQPESLPGLDLEATVDRMMLVLKA